MYLHRYVDNPTSPSLKINNNPKKKGKLPAPCHARQSREKGKKRNENSLLYESTDTVPDQRSSEKC